MQELPSIDPLAQDLLTAADVTQALFSLAPQPQTIATVAIRMPLFIRLDQDAVAFTWINPKGKEEGSVAHGLAAGFNIPLADAALLERWIFQDVRARLRETAGFKNKMHRLKMSLRHSAIESRIFKEKGDWPSIAPANGSGLDAFFQNERFARELSMMFDRIQLPPSHRSAFLPVLEFGQLTHEVSATRALSTNPSLQSSTPRL